jgi:hypothetical protein
VTSDFPEVVPQQRLPPRECNSDDVVINKLINYIEAFFEAELVTDILPAR